MSLASRSFLVLDPDHIERLYDADYRRLCASSTSLVPALAGTRVQWASLVIELHDRRPIRVVHRTFAFLQFDDRGVLDVERMNRDQIARLDVAVSSQVPPAGGSGVIDATSRFASRGGTWKPDHALQRRLDALALGRVTCRRLRVISMTGDQGSP